MKIENFPTKDYNMNVSGEPQTKTVNAQSLSDVVSFGSSLTGFLGEETKNVSLLGESEDTIESLKEKATILKDNLTAVFNKMETGTVVSMDEEGIDVNNTEVKELVTVVEQIQIKLATYCDDFQATVDVDSAAVEAVLGQGAAAYDIAKEFDSTLSDDAKAYLLKNEMKPTIKNVYIAEHAGVTTRKVKALSDKEWQDLKPQVEKIIDKAGMKASNETLGMAKWLVDREIPLNEDTLNSLAELNEIKIDFDSDFLMDRIAATMMEGAKSTSTLITGESLPWEEAVSAIETVNMATPSVVMWWANSDLSYNLDGLREAENLNAEMTPNEQNDKYIKATRQLLEIRLMMTINAGRAIEKSGMKINTMEISDLVEELKNYELKRQNEKLVGKDYLYSKEDISKSNDFILEFMSLKTAPAASLGKLIEKGISSTPENIKNTSVELVQKFEAAGKAYEALSTEIRSDLGDNVAKAVKASTESILDGMGLSKNSANERAVRILAYNEMDVTVENIDKVKAMDDAVNTLFDRLNPECTLKMIREGINPMEMPVEELSEYLLNMQQQLRPRDEKFSEFLYRLDKKREISAEDREKFIGIYSIVNRFNKDGLNAIGSLINQNLELNMSNLMTAYFSRKDKGMELVADDTTPTLHVNDKVTYYKNLFGKAAEKVTPEILSEMGETFEEMSLEEFANKVNEAEIDNEVIYEKQKSDFLKAVEMSNDVYKFVTDYSLFESINTVHTVGEFLSNDKMVFNKYDEETSEDSAEAFLNAMDNKDELIKEYDKLVDNTKKLLEEAHITRNSYVDMEALRMMGNQVHMIQALSRQNYFCIPFSSENTEGIIHLKVVESDNEQGVFNIKFNLRNGSKVTVEGKVDKDSVKASVLCQDENYVKLFEEKFAVIEEKLNGLGFEQVSIRAGKATTHPEGQGKNKEGVTTQRIYSASKIFITNLAN